MVSCDGHGEVIEMSRKARAAVDGITLTEFAAKKVKAFLAKENGRYLRVSVLPGGCAGFSYDFSVEKSAGKEDAVFGAHGVSIVVDKMQLQFLTGSTLEWTESLQGAGLSVDNPNVTKSCGCGHSFG